MSDRFVLYCQYLSALLFSTGVFIVLTKRNVVFVLIGVELLLNAANLVMVSFSVSDPSLKGHIFAIFSVVLTVCEVSIALAILLAVYRKYRSSNLDELREVGSE